ncbi:hypothetical protein HRR83_007728 [Exophiala dermatitidis]|uniref:Het-C-domain-containing protein n=1 Tax=Exophiala dermatitidis TaxID=5970 RepID=A0AAN6ERN2_EXODE|nr:hypothetical protein HRR73_008902 [Exophiala dermatitidis]KAJ4507745.1 hypothetical protein HRR75_006455 [Exophiala dermatitidis]KAJ4509882.1 hypothetical protein HRR74_007034 [Exophiala dermatitidis]KAJ4539565.1 hypothetical protein HRR77_006445 [Exophiala dermatitidis]KAJ4542660.1 hypothetical protein HRR78_006749 [Exophiala dermatitidis]
MALTRRNVLLILLLGLILFSSQAHAFGAGNIASISAVEGKNWRHGDIEDVLKTVACIRHHKWTSMMIKRVYFGNWLRDYSQAMDTGALKKAQPETIRILVWLLSFLAFGYATAEFEVTSERLGVYRPEEHIDNPKDYNDNEDARKYDPRLRAPVRDIELQIDPSTGMKNYIANGAGDWATSAAFVKYSFERSIHHGRLYCNGHGIFKGKDEDLAEALRCLGQGLHTLEDFGAHTNYVELALRELGFHNVFPHVGTATAINLHGKHVFPLVTGTFGMVDFYHSVLGEATDHFTQSEVNEMDNALGTAQQAAQSSNPLMTLVKLLSKVPGTKDLCDEAERLQASSQAQARAMDQGFGGQGGYRDMNDYGGTTRGFDDLQGSRASQAGFPSQPHGYATESWNTPSQQGYQAYHPPQPEWGQPQQPSQWSAQTHHPGFDQQSQPQWHDPNAQQGFGHQTQYSGAQEPWQQQQQHQQQPPQQGYQQGLQGNAPSQVPQQPPQQTTTAPSGLEGMPNFDPSKTIAQIYPILAFRDKVVRTISGIIEKIPGLEALVDRITETLTVFILSLLAPFVRPVLNAMAKTLQTGSEGVINSSANHQYEVWTNPHCSDPTHSMLSKDHFSNILNEPAGNVAAEILKFIAPRVLYAWEHPDVPVQQVMHDVEGIFHHPAIRNEHSEVHRNMFAAVKRWVDGLSDRGRSFDTTLSSEGVRTGKNHKAGVNDHAHVQHQPGAPAAPHQSSSGGLGGFASFLPGQQHHAAGAGGNHNPLGMVGDMIGNFTGHQQSSHQQQQHQQQHTGGGGGGLGDMLSMASKLPIPGVQNVASSLNKYSKYTKFTGGSGFGTRGLDDDDGVGGVNDGSSATTGGYQVGGSELGGSRELHEAAAHANQYGGGTGEGDFRSPSPMPMAPPAGYEQYGNSGRGEYFPQQGEGQAYQYQTEYRDPYQDQNQAQGPGQGQYYGASGGDGSSAYYGGR